MVKRHPKGPKEVKVRKGKNARPTQKHIDRKKEAKIHDYRDKHDLYDWED